MFVALGAALLLLWPRMKDWRALVLLAGGALAAVLCSHLQFVVSHPELYRDAPWSAFRFWEGLRAGGGLAGALLYYVAVARWAPYPLSSIGDYVAPTIWLTIAVMRVHCFSDDCCPVVRVPYFLLAGAMAILSARMIKYRRFDGEVVLISTFLYSFVGLFVETIRVPNDWPVFWISAATFVVSGKLYSLMEKFAYQNSFGQDCDGASDGADRGAKGRD